MNPRYRRLLIPGLLIALLLVVIVSSLIGRADGATARPSLVSRMTDARIVESSGLVASREYAGVVYTINDSGHAPVVYAVEVATGAVVGTTAVSGGDLRDIEAISIDPAGVLWLADTGDNTEQRSDIALYALPEPGPGQHTVTAQRYPLTYGVGPQDVEALVIDPRSGAKTLVTKGLFGGLVLPIPDELSEDRANLLTATDAEVAAMVTDATTSTDGTRVLLRTYTGVHILDAQTWDEVAVVPVAVEGQAESIAMESDGRSYLIGAEGASSPLLRLGYAAPTGAEPTSSGTPAPSEPTPSSPAAPPSGSGFAGEVWVWAVIVIGLLAVVAAAASRRPGGRP